MANANANAESGSDGGELGETKVKSLLQESLSVAVVTKAMAPSDLAQVIVDTTVQSKAALFNAY